MTHVSAVQSGPGRCPRSKSQGEVTLAEVPGWLGERRSAWRYRGADRPAEAVVPGPGQESVWDYPRPPVLERDARLVEVRLGQVLIARTKRAIRVLETASPPTFYLPPEDVHPTVLVPAAGASMCEWKGTAGYWNVVVADQTISGAAWSYPEPFPEFVHIEKYLAFFPAKVECYLAGERVTPQPGEFYGGWVSSEIVGPFKGDPGSASW
jgi:uncharacterized protein (DUF427 family)